MAALRSVVLIALLAGASGSIIDTGVAANPIRRGAAMLQLMQKKVEADGKMQQLMQKKVEAGCKKRIAMYEQCMCWCETGAGSLEKSTQMRR